MVAAIVTHDASRALDPQLHTHIVRPVSCIEDETRRKAAGNAKYELVVGERRWRGSKIAAKTEIPSVIRKLNDHEALKLQVIENAQREDPDPLEEAEQYDGLLKSGKTTVDELCAEIGKSRATIYGRIKLLGLPEKVKEALRVGKITPQVALLIARIPNSKVAEEAATRILKGDHSGQPLSFRQVQAFIAEEYMTQLKGAPFDPKDKTLDRPEQSRAAKDTPAVFSPLCKCSQAYCGVPGAGRCHHLPRSWTPPSLVVAH